MLGQARLKAAAVVAVAVLGAGVLPGAAHAAGKPSHSVTAPVTTGSPHASRSPRTASSGAVSAGKARSFADAADDVPAGVGPERNATLLPFQISARVGLRVNVGSGDASVATDDLDIPGISGSLLAGTTYNSLLAGSQLQNSGSHGPGWKARSGVDDTLFPDGSGNVTFYGPDGVSGTFTPQSGSASDFNTPSEFKAGLVKTADGYVLTWHTTGERWYFTTGGRLTKKVDRNGNATTFSYDANGFPTAAESTRGDAGTRTLIVHTNASGLITKIEQLADSMSRSVSYDYDTQNRMVTLTDATGRVTRFDYTGNDLTKITAGSGAITEIAYDAQHRVTAVTQHPDAQTANVTRLAYPSSGQVLVADANTDQAQAVADVPHTTYEVNDSARVTKATDPAGNSRSVTYTPFHDVASSTGATGGVTTNAYGANAGESLTKTTLPTGASTSADYGNANSDANPTAAWQPSSQTDTQGNATAYTYNGPGNLTDAANAAAAKAQLGWNDDGTVKSSTDPKGNVTTYGYNANKELDKITPPSGGSMGAQTFTWDDFGRMASTTDGAGNTIKYYYNNNDQVTSTTSGGQQISYAYDDNGNLRWRNTQSEGISVDVTNWTFDGTDRATSRQASSGGGTLSYAYDAVGNLKGATDAHGSTTYTYNTRNWLTAMQTPDGLTTAFSYDADGNRTNAFFGATPGDNTKNAARTKWTYDDSGRITRVTTTRDSGAVTVSDVSYCYAVPTGTCSTAKSDDTGLRQWSVNDTSGTTSVFGYDKANHLTKATNVNGHDYAYGYDANGNRTSESIDGTATNTTFNAQNQTTSGGATFDGAGRQTTTPQGVTMSWSPLGQMTGADRSGTHTDYTYAGTTNTELLSAGSRTYTWGLSDAHGTPWLQSFTSGTDQGYINRDGYGTPISLQTNNTSYYYATDGLGSVTNLIAKDGTTAATYTYDPYGRVSAQAGGNTPEAKTMAQAATNTNPLTADATAGTGAATAPAPGQAGPLAAGIGFSNPHGYTAGIWDAGTSHVKLGQRYYNPADGRLTQTDPITQLANPNNANVYAYAADNPINYTDPTGRITSSCVLGLVSLGASIYGFSSATAALVTGVGGAAATVEYAVAGVGLAASTATIEGSCGSWI